MNKKLYFLLFLGLSIISFQKPLYADDKTQKKIVENAFRDWERNEGSPFSLLSEDATWTVMGPTQSAKTYTIPELRKNVLEPFNARLKEPLTPTLLDIFQVNNTVIILFEATGTMINGETYKNSYAWFFSMEEGKVKNVRAVLDLSAFDYLMSLNVE